jgi:cysteine synthase A
MSEMAAAGEKGSVVTILCDSGDRYRSTLFDDQWLAEKGLSCAAYEADLENWIAPPVSTTGKDSYQSLDGAVRLAVS